MCGECSCSIVELSCANLPLGSNLIHLVCVSGPDTIYITRAQPIYTPPPAILYALKQFNYEWRAFCWLKLSSNCFGILGLLLSVSPVGLLASVITIGFSRLVVMVGGWWQVKFVIISKQIGKHSTASRWNDKREHTGQIIQTPAVQNTWE